MVSNAPDIAKRLPSAWLIPIPRKVSGLVKYWIQLVFGAS
jgi:hypothetical protein